MKLLVIGNITLDISYELEHLPRPGETLLAKHRNLDLGGKGFNQAVVAARAGATVRFVAAVGSETDNTLIHNVLKAEQLSPDGILLRDGSTDESIIYLTTSGENCIVSTCGMATSLTTSDVAPSLQQLQRDDLLLMQGNLSQHTTATSLIQARARGCTTLLNPAPIAYSYNDILPHVDYLIVNQIESHFLSGRSEPADAAYALLDHGSRAVITTLGKDGALLTDQSRTTHYPAPQVAAIDTTGAGDVFCGVFAAALARKLPLSTACPWAVAAASLSVTRRGTLRSFPTSNDLAILLEASGRQLLDNL
jgi:ribokinase